MATHWLVVHHAPSLAGGPLRLLNWVLHACAAAQQMGPQARVLLLLDDRLSQERDRALLLLNARGDPTVLPGPSNGRLWPAERAALAAAACDTLPPTRHGPEIVERLLPPPDTAPEGAAGALWNDLLGALPVDCRATDSQPERLAPEFVIGPKPPPLGSAVGPPLWPDIPRWQPPETTWFAPRHLELLRQLHLPPELALGGETALRQAAAFRSAEDAPLFARLRAVEETLADGLQALRLDLQREHPELYGAWVQLRRRQSAGIQDFRRRAARTLRNRHGIRGARLHALAQGLRPGGAAQEDGLGLLAASTLFGLDLGRLPAYRDACAGAAPGRPLLLDAARAAPLLGAEPG